MIIRRTGYVDRYFIITRLYHDLKLLYVYLFHYRDENAHSGNKSIRNITYDLVLGTEEDEKTVRVSKGKLTLCYSTTCVRVFRLR